MCWVGGAWRRLVVRVVRVRVGLLVLLVRRVALCQRVEGRGVRAVQGHAAGAPACTGVKGPGGRLHMAVLVVMRTGVSRLGRVAQLLVMLSGGVGRVGSGRAWSRWLLLLCGSGRCTCGDGASHACGCVVQP